MEHVLASIEAHAERMVDRQSGDGEAGVEDAEDQSQLGGVGVREPAQDERDHRGAPDHVNRGVQRVGVGEPLRQMVVREAERVEQQRGDALAEQPSAEQSEEDLRPAGHVTARGRRTEALAQCERRRSHGQRDAPDPGRCTRHEAVAVDQRRDCDQRDERERAERERPHGLSAPLEGGQTRTEGERDEDRRVHAGKDRHELPRPVGNGRVGEEQEDRAEDPEHHRDGSEDGTQPVRAGQGGSCQAERPQRHCTDDRIDEVGDEPRVRHSVGGEVRPVHQRGEQEQRCDDGEPGDEDARVDRMARDARKAEADCACEVERGDEARVERRRMQREADDVGRCEESCQTDREALRGSQ